MSDRTVTITLTAKDGVTHTFQAVAKSGEQMGDALNRAAKDAARGLDDLGESASKAGRDFESIKNASRDVGLGIGVLAGGLALSGKAFRDQEIALNSLDRSFGVASQQMRDFAQQIQATTNYSNDAAVASENIAATLARNYGLTADEIQRVVQISADLAATSGLGLEDTTYRVVAAIRGEAEAAEALGLTMNQQSIDRENLTQTMSNEEAAHFRLNALYEQAAFAQGAAAEQANTTYGSMVDLGHGFQDAAQSVGEFLGPMGEIGAYLSDNVVKVGGLTLALGQLGKSAAGLNTLATSLTGINAGAAVAGSGIAGLAGTAGIAGLGIAATIAVTGGVGMLIGKLAVDTPKAAGDAAASIQELIDLALQLDNVGALGADLLQLQDAQGYNDAIIEITGHLNELMAVGNDLYAMSDDPAKQILPVDDPAFAAFSHNAQLVIDSNDDMMISFEEVSAAYDAMAYDNMAMAESAAAMNSAIAAGADEFDTLLQLAQGTGPAANYARESLDNLTQGLLNGTVGPEKYEEALQSAIEHVHDMQAATLAGADATSQYTAANQTFVSSLQARQNAASHVANAMAQDAQHMGDAVEGNTTATQAYVSALEFRLFLEKQVEQITSGRNQTERLFGLSQKDAANSVTQLNTALAKQAAMLTALNDLNARSAGREAANAKADAAAIGAVTEKWRERVDAIKEAEDAQRAADYTASRQRFDAGSFRQIADAADAAALSQATEALSHAWDGLKQSFNGAAEALDAGFRTVVGNTDAIAKQSQAVADWAENLIAAEGVYSKLDDLVNAGRITGESGVFTGTSEYAQAQQAYNSILADNAAIQEHVLTIQAKQAPTLAEMESNLESYLGTLADASPEQQAFALAMMDSATSTQAFDLATGLIENRDVFGPMAESLANLNPFLGEALVQMGLMDKVYNDSTGTYEYHLKVDGGEEALSQTQQLTQAIEALNKTFTIALGIEVDDSALTSLRAGLDPMAKGSYGGGAGGAIQISVTADTSSADESIRAVASTTIPEKTAVILGDDTGATQSIRSVNDAAIQSKTLTIGGENGAAVSAINTVNNMAVYDKTMTINVVTAYSTIGSPTAIGNQPMMHGGIVDAAAMGRVMTGPTIVGENGWELLLGGEGRGGMVFPHTGSAESVKRQGGAPVIRELHVHATGDWDEIAYQVGSKLMPAIERAFVEHYGSV